MLLSGVWFLLVIVVPLVLIMLLALMLMDHLVLFMVFLPPRCVADLELVLDVHKSSVNFHPVLFDSLIRFFALQISSSYYKNLLSWLH